MTIRVLIIDDSATMRAILKTRLEAEPDLEVVATAATALEGRALIKQYNPDVVTLDIEMPGMDGLDFLEKVMTLRPMPVIIVSGSTHQGSQMTARALALGAVDCYAKHEPGGSMLMQDNGKLSNLIRAAAKVSFKGRNTAPKVATRKAVVAPSPLSFTAQNVSMIAIGASTGGVEALEQVLCRLPADCPPTLVVQHLNPRFIPAVVRTLDAASAATVVSAEPDMPLKRGHVYIAPGGDRHMMVGGRQSHYIRLRQGDPVAGHRPSVDVLFQSVTEVAEASAVGILLTGMGEDGARGMLQMANAGALTIAQDEASCTVFGMPRAAIALGAARIVAPLSAIAEQALRKAA